MLLEVGPEFHGASMLVNNINLDFLSLSLSLSLSLPHLGTFFQEKVEHIVSFFLVFEAVSRAVFDRSLVDVGCVFFIFVAAVCMQIVETVISA